jgi:hypothetical protein
MGLSTDTMAGAKDAAVNGSANGTPSSAAAKYNLPSHFIGGNHLEVAAPSKVRDFVASHGGHTVITNVRDSPRIPYLPRFWVFWGFWGNWWGQWLTLAFSTGPHCKQRYCSSQGDPIGAEMGIRDFWR